MDITTTPETVLLTEPATRAREAKPWRRFLRRRVGVGALILLLLLIVVSLLAPVLEPYDPNAQNLRALNLGPSAQHLLGTDSLGRDILSRLLRSGIVTIGAAFEAVGLAIVLGVPLGLAAGYLGGWFDWVLSVVNDTLMAIPPIVLAIAIVGIRGPGLGNTVLAIGVLMAPRLYRVARAVSGTAKHEGYVRAARTVGCTGWRIVVRHILPNTYAPLLVQTSFLVGVAVITESSLSFLGLGSQPPSSTWGSMLRDAFNNVNDNVLPIFPPSVMITLTILVLSTLGDEWRDVLSKAPVRVRRQR